jgi:hypothetical protein
MLSSLLRVVVIGRGVGFVVSAIVFLGLASSLALAAVDGPDAAGPSRAKRAPAARLFAPTSFWNRRLPADVPLDPDSPRLVAWLADEVTREYAGHRGPWVNDVRYSTPLYVVGPRQRRVRVRLVGSADSGLRAAFAHVPLPRNARPAGGSDAHLTVWQPSRDRLWEFWQLSRDARGEWQAQYGGAIDHVSRSPGYFRSDSWPRARPWWGATATGLPKIGGTMLLSEIAAGSIPHALAMDIPGVRPGVFSWPAQRTDGSGAPDALPEGARLRLDPRLDIDALDLPPFTRMVARAAQRYGLVVRDQSTDVTLAAEDPTPTGANPFFAADGRPRPHGPYGGVSPSELMQRFPWRSLQVLKLRLCSTSPCRHG